MTDINKQIEEEAREFAFKSCPYHYSDCEIEHCNSNCQWHRYSQQDDSYKKFKQGAQFVLNSSRWRKVSEGLPEDNIDLLDNTIPNIECTHYILVKTTDGHIYENRRLKMAIGAKEWVWAMSVEGYTDFIEWKPIY